MLCEKGKRIHCDKVKNATRWPLPQLPPAAGGRESSAEPTARRGAETKSAKMRGAECGGRMGGAGETDGDNAGIFPAAKRKGRGCSLTSHGAKHIINMYGRSDFPAGQRVDKALMGPMTAGCRSQRESPRLEGFHRHRSAPPRSFRSIPDESAALRRDRVAARCAAIWVVPRRLTAFVP